MIQVVFKHKDLDTVMAASKIFANGLRINFSQYLVSLASFEAMDIFEIKSFLD